jgi:hypothetical protein
MKLHENRDLFANAVTITAQQMQLPEIYVEKDYWVTLALQRIFTGPLAEFTVFKGGTALSKCFSFIKRFSEDIDLVLLQDPTLSANQHKERLKRISQTVAELIPEVALQGTTNKKGMIRKTAHSYSQVFMGEFGQVRDLIILESSWLGSSEPVIPGLVSSFIYQMMQTRGQEELALQYNLMPFEVVLLSPTRTLCEKIMSLVRFSYTQNPLVNLRQKIRHLYDIHQLLGQQELKAFFGSTAFDTMLHKVAQDDAVSFRDNKEWLANHPTSALIFSDIDSVWLELKAAYLGSFKNLVFGPLPSAEAIQQTLIQLKERIALIEWKVEI